MNRRSIATSAALVTLVACAVMLSACLTGVQCPPPSGAAVKIGHPLTKPDTTAMTCSSSGGGGSNSNCTSGLTPNNVLLTLGGSGNILEYSIDNTTGALTLMCNTAVAVADGQLAVSTNNFLYVFEPGEKQIQAFSIAHGNSGALMAVTGSPFTITLTQQQTLDGFTRVTPDPLGRFLFVTDFSNDLVHVFAISTVIPGALTEVTNSPFSFSSPNGVAIDATGTFAFVPDDVDGQIQILTISSTGQLAPAAGSPFIVGQNSPDAPHFAILHPSNQFVFTANNSSISAFTFDPVSGEMFLVQGTPVSTTPSQITPDELAIDNTGSFIFSDDVGTNGVTGFPINTGTGEIGPATVPNAPAAWPLANSQMGIGILGAPATPNIFTLNVTSSATTTGVVNNFGVTAGTGQLVPPTANSTLVAAQTMAIANIQ